MTEATDNQTRRGFALRPCLCGGQVAVPLNGSPILCPRCHAWNAWSDKPPVRTEGIDQLTSRGESRRRRRLARQPIIEVEEESEV